MKNFFILFKLNIKDIWQNNRFIFVLIVSFMFLSFTFIPLAFNAINYALFELDGNYIDNTFSFKLNSVENLENNLKNYINQTDDIQCIFFSFECENLIENNTSTIFALYQGDFRKDGNISLGNWFSDSQMKNGDKVIVAPYYTFFKRTSHGNEVTKYELGSTFNINGEDYIIIGESSITRYVFFIPYNSIENKEILFNLHISIDNKYTLSKTEKFAKNVTKYFDCEIVELAESRNSKIENIFKVLYCLIFSIGIINLIYIYKFLLEQRTSLIGVFKMYGMNKSKCISYLLFEFLLWLLICYFVSFVFINLFLAISINLFNASLYFFELWEHLLFLGLYLFLYFICFFPTIADCVDKNNEIELINNNNGG